MLGEQAMVDACNRERTLQCVVSRCLNSSHFNAFRTVGVGQWCVLLMHCAQACARLHCGPIIADKAVIGPRWGEGRRFFCKTYPGVVRTFPVADGQAQAEAQVKLRLRLPLMLTRKLILRLVLMFWCRRPCASWCSVTCAILMLMLMLGGQASAHTHTDAQAHAHGGTCTRFCPKVSKPPPPSAPACLPVCVCVCVFAFLCCDIHLGHEATLQ